MEGAIAQSSLVALLDLDAYYLASFTLTQV